MGIIRAHKGWAIAAAVVVLLGLAATVGIAGWSGDTGVGQPSFSRDSGGVSNSTAGATTTTWVASGVTSDEDQWAGDVSVSAAPRLDSSQKVISDAQIQIEVQAKAFQSAYQQLLFLADRYGGYVVSSGSQATGEEGTIKSGSVTIRVPAESFGQAMSDVAKLGEVKSQQIESRDVTEEYVDLEARRANAAAHVKALLDLLERAKSVDEILQVQQVLSNAQLQSEELEGRLRYLDEHTSYSTINIIVYEAGAIVAPPGEWGVKQAFSDALHNLIDALNAIVRGLGVMLPVLAVLAIIAYVAYRIWRVAAIRQARRQAASQPSPLARSAPQPPVYAGESVPPDRAAQAPNAGGGDQAGPE